VYICGPTDSTHAPPIYASDVLALETQISALEQFAGEISGVLERGNVVARQACYLPFHERGFPALGWVTRTGEGRSGVFVAAGHGVWGISLGPGTGMVVAEMVLGGREGRGEGWDVSRLAP
jgi:glycine/D-amino acid oxidase-like deaminating enzyme